MDAATLVDNARSSAGRSYRPLAAEADVAVSTVTRIEAGKVVPTVEVLARILDACGYRLELVAVRHGVPERLRLRDLAGAWRPGPRGPELDWTRWRAWLDDLTLRPDLVPEAIYPAPPPSGHPVVDALLAAVAEKLADDAGVPRPAWTTVVPPLDEPFRPPTRRRNLEIPSQLAERSIMIDSASLFRSRPTVGV